MRHRMRYDAADYETDDFDTDDYSPGLHRSIRGTVESFLLLGALALIATPAIQGIARRYRVRRPLATDEGAIDKSLKDTFPASDPPASRYVDIPVNRRDTH